MLKPIPKITAEEFREKVDYQVGDVVQIIRGKYAGRVGIIMRIDPFFTDRCGEILAYCLRLSDREGVTTRGAFLRFIKHADDGEI